MAKQNLEFASETARVGVDLGDAEPINVHISGTRTSPGPGQTIDVPLGFGRRCSW